uniref:Uncharacterized protein n=1 Tax=Peronospora matthiolae TaxID=2874970 RepID=A0AAV1TVC8_9STRA
MLTRTGAVAADAMATWCFPLEKVKGFLTVKNDLAMAIDDDSDNGDDDWVLDSG